MKFIIDLFVRLSAGLIISAAVFFSAVFVQEVSAKGIAAHAQNHVGLHENKHTKKLKRILGHNPRGKSNAWCGSYVCAMAKKAGKKCPRGYLSARAWEKAGRSVKRSSVGRNHVVTFYSKAARSGRHVGIVIRRKGSKILVNSGNQKNKVNERWYNVSSVKKARKL